MLTSIDLNGKTYEEMIAEAMAQIPLYSAQWTNFNPSDPGITVLQNLTAFNLLQTTQLNEVSEAVQRGLLALLGYRSRENKSARLLLQAPAEAQAQTLPATCLFRAGTVSFETEQELALRPWGLQAAYCREGGEYRDVTYLLARDIASFAYPFGAAPRSGNALYLLLTDCPETDRPVHLWAQTVGEERRNPFAGDNLRFAATRWQYYTEAGWQDAETVDETRDLLVSGEIALSLKSGQPAVFSDGPQSGYALRCLLEEGYYDMPPRLSHLAVNLFPVWQCRTHSKSYRFNGGQQIHLRSELAVLGNLFVYCREEKGGPYRLYAELPREGLQGRYYHRTDHMDGVTLTFDKKAFGHGPGRGYGAIRVVCYDEEMIHHRDLGLVYGYEDQVVELDLVRDLLPGRFSLLAETQDEGGEPVYTFVEPGNTDPDTLCYTLEARDGQVIIRHPGFDSAYRLYLCDCAVTAGEGGNLRAGNLLSRRAASEYDTPQQFFTPAFGQGGSSYESVEQLRRQLARDARRPRVAVTAADHEALALQTPGLCLHKVAAIAAPEENLVKLVVKPYTEEKQPRLSPLYLEQLARWMEQYRLLTDRIELVQPNYVPMDVEASIAVRSYYGEAEQEITALLEKRLDQVSDDRRFGGWVRFNELYQALMALDCVQEVENLRLTPATRSGVQSEGLDWRLDAFSLCCPGSIRLTLHTRIGR